MPLGPAAVHAHEHLGPVAGLGAAGAGLDAQVGVAGVLRTAEHGPHLELAESLFDGVQLAFQLGFQDWRPRRTARPALEIVAGVGQLLVGLEQAVERLELGDDLLGLLGVVPEVRLAHLGGELFALGLFGRDVKESPAAGSNG